MLPVSILAQNVQGNILLAVMLLLVLDSQVESCHKRQTDRRSRWCHDWPTGHSPRSSHTAMDPLALWCQEPRCIRPVRQQTRVGNTSQLGRRRVQASNHSTSCCQSTSCWLSGRLSDWLTASSSHQRGAGLAAAPPSPGTE